MAQDQTLIKAIKQHKTVTLLAIESQLKRNKEAAGLIGEIVSKNGVSRSIAEQTRDAIQKESEQLELIAQLLREI